MDDLTQRLREAAEEIGDDDFAEAAARIEALDAEVARLRDSIDRAARAWPIVRDADCSGGTLASAMDEIEDALTPPHVQHTAGVDATAPTSGHKSPEFLTPDESAAYLATLQRHDFNPENWAKLADWFAVNRRQPDDPFASPDFRPSFRQLPTVYGDVPKPFEARSIAPKGE